MLKPKLAALPRRQARFACFPSTDSPSTCQCGLVDPLSVDEPTKGHGPSDLPKFTELGYDPTPSGSSRRSPRCATLYFFEIMCLLLYWFLPYP